MTRWAVNYEDLLGDVHGCSYTEVADYLLEQLPYEWRDRYISQTPLGCDVRVVTENRLSYQFDFFDIPQSVPVVSTHIVKEARLVAVYGYACKPTAKRPSSGCAEMLNYVGHTEKYFGSHYDKGHFIAHTLGGGLNINLFPQVRRINRGWSSEGKLYVQMERYCRDNLGVMLFSRPLYADGTARPAAVEFGVLRREGDLWVHVFSNTL